MKRVCIVFSLILISAVAANAQGAFRVGLGLGYAMSGGDGSSGGFLGYLEPGYKVNDNILVNFRLEGCAITRGLSEPPPGGVSLDVAGISSYTFNGQYYFGTSSFKPFAGVGLGLFSLAAVSAQGSSTTVEAGTKFGFYPRVGFDMGHFTMSLDYNIIPASEIPGSSVTVVNNYLGIRLGFFIGGGE